METHSMLVVAFWKIVYLNKYGRKGHFFLIFWFLALIICYDVSFCGSWSFLQHVWSIRKSGWSRHVNTNWQGPLKRSSCSFLISSLVAKIVPPPTSPPSSPTTLCKLLSLTSAVVVGRYHSLPIDQEALQGSCCQSLLLIWVSIFWPLSYHSWLPFLWETTCRQKKRTWFIGCQNIKMLWEQYLRRFL